MKAGRSDSDLRKVVFTLQLIKLLILDFFEISLNIPLLFPSKYSDWFFADKELFSFTKASPAPGSYPAEEISYFEVQKNGQIATL